MEYKIIKSALQYESYCDKLHELVINPLTRESDEVELLTLLTTKWETDNIKFSKLTPIETIKELMQEHQLNSTDLSRILNLSKGTISKMLNYNKGLSKETIRNLSAYFKLNQEIFNQPYKLDNEINHKFRDASLTNTKKGINKVSHPV
jgi:HTH-type transcriptional regulator/antitoxin HigA